MYESNLRLRSLGPAIAVALFIVACATPASKPIPPATSANSSTGAPLPASAAAKAVEMASVSPKADAELAAKSSLAVTPDSYVVQPGDTLALIARRAEIYGDSSMWMMLYRANAGQIPNMDWICPGEVLAIPRSYTEADARASRQEALRRAPWPTGAKVKGGYLCDRLPRSASVRGDASRAAAAARSAKPTDVAKSVTAAGDVPAVVSAAVVKRAGEPAVVAAPEKGSAMPTAASPAISRSGPELLSNGGASASSQPVVSPGIGSATEARSAPVVVPTSVSPVTVGTSRSAYRDAARRAYSMRDVPWAIYYYRQHLAKVPRDTDALGELGNIYYQAGNLPTAAAFFYDAARLLIEKGRRDAASRLLLAVSEGNPALANDLYMRLSARSKR